MGPGDSAHWASGQGLASREGWKGLVVSECAETLPGLGGHGGGSSPAPSPSCREPVWECRAWRGQAPTFEVLRSCCSSAGPRLWGSWPAAVPVGIPSSLSSQEVPGPSE